MIFIVFYSQYLERIIEQKVKRPAYQFSRQEEALFDLVFRRKEGKPRKSWPFTTSFAFRRKALLKIMDGALLRLKNLKDRKDSENLSSIGNLFLILKSHLQHLRGEPMATQELFLNVVGISLYRPPIFGGFITDIQQEHPLGLQIAVHNALLQSEFEKAGINWDRWCNFSEKTKRTADTFEKVKNKNLKWIELNEYLNRLVKEFHGNPLEASIRKDAVLLRQKKSQILSGNLEIDMDSSDWQKILFPTYHKSLAYLKEKGQDVSVAVHGVEYLWQVRRILIELSKKPVRYSFGVKLWERYPLRDLLQGNLSNCCLAIGGQTYPAVRLSGVPCKKYPAGVLDYLVDKGIQVAEVIDDNLGKTGNIGQCWLFVALGDDGKPMLVADSFDLDRKYTLSGTVNETIRDVMFEFLKKYADACGIKKIVLGKVGPRLDTGHFHFIGNCVEVKDLQVASCAPIQKLGGYWNHAPYFLETVGGNEVYVIR